MRIRAVSILAVFACFPCLADARLPIVNVAAGSVSARAAFGEPIDPKPAVAESRVANAVTVTPAPKAVVARTATVDSGQTIAKNNSADVLVPRRPSGDLWAKNNLEKPLRLPEPQEFSVIRSDFELPEESLNSQVVARTINQAPQTADFGIRQDVSELDAEISRLVELQRKADESLRMAAARPAPAPVAAPSTISSYDLRNSAPARVAARPAEVSREFARQEVSSRNLRDEVDVRRMVVPMEEEVVIRQVKSADAPTFANVNQDMSKMSPTELKKAFKKTYLSENKHLSTYKIDDRFDVAGDLSSTMEGFTSTRDLSETGGVRPLEIKIGFRGEDSSLSRDNYNLLSEYAGIVASNPKRAIQISIPQHATKTADGRKLAARRLAIVEQVLKDTGISDQRIMPVLAGRNDDSFVLRVISSDQFETMTQQKRDMFGDSVGKKTYKSMTW